ncbi:MAG: TonB-dependent receptor [Gammaproteobacteria bacterium]|nr:MAG: TonB-dependent receptor [Gammaproteobacteria bacterium]
MHSSVNEFSPLRGAIASVAAGALALPVMLSIPVAGAAVMEEIVTTARGRAESLADVPAAVSVITADTIEKQGIDRVEEFVRLVPGMSIVNAAEVADTQVNIRGINGARDAEVNYALVVDGIVMTNPAALNREWSNISQIEVLKGPQGALYGRNAAAGAIIINTLRPSEPLEGQLKASAAEDSTYSLNGRLGGVNSDETLTWLVSADWSTTDGFYKDVYNNRDDTIDNFEDWNVAGRLIWEPNEQLSVDTKIRYGEVDAASITFNSVFHIPNFVTALGIFGQPPERAAAGYENVNEHPFQFNPNIQSFNNQESLEFSIKADYDLGWADLVGWFLYSDIDNNLGADGTSGAFGFFWSDQRCIDTTTEVANSGFVLGAPQALVPGLPQFSVYGAYTPTSCDGTQYQERNQEDYSVELRLRSKSDQRLRWEAGLYYLNIDREVGVNLGIDRAGVIVPQLFTTDPANPTEQLVHDNFQTDVYSVFGQLAYDLRDNLELSFALRYDREEREVKNLVPVNARTEFLVCTPVLDPTTDYVGGDPINPGLCVDPTGASANKSKTFDQWQPKLSLRWNVTDRLIAYGSAGVGFKSGGFNNFGSQATVDQYINGVAVAGTGFSRVNISDDFKEETSKSYEIGFKSDIGDNFRWEGAAYWVEVDDQQFFEFFVGQFGLLRVVSNIDETTIKGIELGATWAATDWLSLYANGNWIDTEIDKNSARPDTVGNEAPYTPKYTFAFGADFTWPLTSSLDLIANLSINGVGKTWFHVVQDQQRPTIFGPALAAVVPDANGEYSVARRDSYELIDLRVGIAGERWTLTAFGTNITDEKWLQEVIPAPEFGGSFIHPGSRSRFGIEASYRF